MYIICIGLSYHCQTDGHCSYGGRRIESGQDVERFSFAVAALSALSCSHASDALRSNSGTRFAPAAFLAVAPVAVDVLDVWLDAAADVDETLPLLRRAEGGAIVVNGTDDGVAVDSKNSFSMAEMSKSADCMTG